MAEIYFTAYNKESPKGTMITIVEIEGAIGDSAAVDVFEKKITELVEENDINLVLKLDKLRYINSSSMGILIKFIDILKEKGGGIVLAEAGDDIKNPINLLGLDSVITLTDTVEEAINQFDGTTTESKDTSGSARFKEESKAKKETQQKKIINSQASKEDAKVELKKGTPIVSVMMVIPTQDLFEKIMRKKFAKKRAKVSSYGSTEEAESALNERNYDLIIVDEVVKGSKEFVNRLKRNKNTSSIPVLKLYEEGGGFEKTDGLTMKEDNRLEEPFDLDQLSELSMIEYDKIAKRKLETEHHLAFSFNSRQQDIENVNDLILHLMKQTGLNEKESISLGAAFREGTDNANRHGNKSQEDRKVYVDYNLQKDIIYIHIRDEGDGFDWHHYMGVAQGTSAEQRSRDRTAKGKRGGLGIMLMMKCTDEVKYNEKGNELTLIKNRT